MCEPTKEQIKESWKGYGLAEQSTGSWYTNSTPAVYVYYELITPDNPLFIYYIFKYAVPKVRAEMADQYIGLKTLMLEWLERILQGEDPALALFWALDKIRKAEQL